MKEEIKTKGLIKTSLLIVAIISILAVAIITSSRKASDRVLPTTTTTIIPTTLTTLPITTTTTTTVATTTLPPTTTTTIIPTTLLTLPITTTTTTTVTTTTLPPITTTTFIPTTPTNYIPTTSQITTTTSILITTSETTIEFTDLIIKDIKINNFPITIQPVLLKVNFENTISVIVKNIGNKISKGHTVIIYKNYDPFPLVHPNSVVGVGANVEYEWRIPYTCTKTETFVMRIVIDSKGEINYNNNEETLNIICGD